MGLEIVVSNKMPKCCRDLLQSLPGRMEAGAFLQFFVRSAEWWTMLGNSPAEIVVDELNKVQRDILIPGASKLPTPEQVAAEIPQLVDNTLERLCEEHAAFHEMRHDIHDAQVWWSMAKIFRKTRKKK